MQCNNSITFRLCLFCLVSNPEQKIEKQFKSKLQTIQNKCIRFCLQLGCRSHTGIKKFEQINWLLVSERFNPCICSNTFKFFNENCPLYLYDLYKPSGQDQNTLSYLTPTIWNNLPTCLKLSNSLNSFKHGVKEHFFKKLKTKNKIFLLIEVMHVASISISNYYLIFGNVSAGEGALDFPVVLELIQLLIGL